MNIHNQYSPCGDFENNLKAYFDGELSDRERSKVEAHVQGCPRCQEELKFMEILTKEIGSEEMTPLNTDLRDKILQSASTGTPALPPAKSEVSEPPLLKAPKRDYRRVYEYGMAFSLLVVVGVGVLSIMGNRIKNTFNAAANAITTGDDYTFSQAGSADSPSRMQLPANAPSFENSSRLKVNDFKQQAQASSSLGGPVQIYQRSVHKEGNLTVAVNDAEVTGGAVESMVKKLGGFVANNELTTNGSGQKTATLDVRVPVDHFENVVKNIGRMGTVKAKNISGEDVTARVAVAGARRQTLSNQLSIAQAQMRNLAKVRKPDSSDMYRARAEVRGLSLQASQAKAELDTLRKFAALSTLYVTLRDKTKTVAPASFSGTLGQTGTEAWNSFLTTAKLPIQLVIWILAYSPLWLPALILWKRFGRKLVLGD
ncbi:DUF4349 domain-containing protein [bacterium]|nr:MAG: DUF4349 domain-containing protein [bacterium]